MDAVLVVAMVICAIYPPSAPVCGAAIVAWVVYLVACRYIRRTVHAHPGTAIRSNPSA